MSQELHEIVRSLVDHDAIRAAGSAVQAAIERVKEAETDLVKAREVRKAAHAAHQAAVHDGEGNPVATKRALVEADEALELAQELREARERALERANTTGVQDARRHAHGKLLIDGIRRRMAAIRAGETARAALAEAQADFALGTALLNEARGNGVSVPDEVLSSAHGLVDRHGDPAFARTEQQERAVWAPTLDVDRTLEEGKPTR